MKDFKGTKGKFKDGHTGWIVDTIETNGVKGYEIHWSDDGECVTDHVYTKEDAHLIASAPELLEALQVINDLLNDDIEIIKGDPIHFSIKEILNKALN